MTSSSFFLLFCNKSEPGYFYRLGSIWHSCVVTCILSIMYNVNIYAMHILCLNETNAAVNMAVCIFPHDHSQ